MSRSAATNWSTLVVMLAGLMMGCNPGTRSSTSASPEAAGANCPTGGVVLRTGVDADADGVVSEAEAATTTYVCNGAASTPSLSSVTAENAGANCPAGGYRLETGLDANHNGTLDAAEIASTQYLCASDAAASGVLLNKTYLGGADASCEGGYVRVGYGVDTDGNGTLSATEQTASFLACNALPRLTSGSTVTVADCTASPIVLPITSADLDGRVAQTDVRVLASGSPVAFSTGANGEIRLSPGAHVAGADLEVTLIDDLGATSVTMVRVVFSGTGCTPFDAFYGVNPATCRAVEVDGLAGDDRSGPVITRRAAYYNGDYGLVRVGLDLDGGVQLIARPVDTLMGDAVQGQLLSLWSSDWNSVLADGGVGPGVTSLLDPDAGDRFTALNGPEALDQIALLDETTFQPTSRVTLPQPITVANEFTATLSDGGLSTFAADRTLLSAAAGQALVARRGSNVDGDIGVLLQLIDTSTGVPTLDRALIFPQGETAADAWRWNTQEDTFQHYALFKRGTQYVLTYLTQDGWYEVELASGAPVLRSTTFATDCDTANLALSADLSTAYFHAEGGCFGVQGSEQVLRCGTLFSDNLDGGVDDRGTTNGGREKR